MDTNNPSEEKFSNPSSGDNILTGRKVVVVVPAYNEERFIGSVLLKILQHPVEVLVVDDGSKDQTAAIARAAGAQVISLYPNQGKGAALNAGLCKARERNPDAIVLIDGDGQHLPEELLNLVTPVLEGKADIVVGSRYLRNTSNTPLLRRLGHKVFNWLVNLSSGVSISDSQCGYRAFSPRAYEAIDFSSHDFSAECEMQFIAHQMGLRITEVPVTVQYTDKAKRSVVKQGLVVLNGLFRLTGQYRPLLFFGLSGLTMLGIGLMWALLLVEQILRSGQIIAGQVLACVLLIIGGMIWFSTGVILHSVRGLLLDLIRPNNRHS